jgi:hypothetical protein
VITWLDVTAKIAGVVHKPAYILYSVTGAGGTWDSGYGYFLGDTLEQEGLIEHQPISYGPNGIPGAFPMEPSIQMGIAELSRQILLRDPSEPWALALYSEGAIVGSRVFDLVRAPGHPLNAYLASFLGAVTFGNPRREEGHTVPGGIDPGGHGIVTPNMVDTPDNWLDFAAGKHMAGSPGDDLYTTCGSGTSAEVVADQEAIWTIVDQGTFSSFGDLAKQILKLLPNPLSGGLAAIQAALSALDFFVVHGLTPHTSYQFIQPVAGDPRDCWQMALDYLASLANRPAPVGASSGPAILASAVLPQTVKDAIVTTPVTTPAPAAAPLDLEHLKDELKTAVDGLLGGLKFVQKYEALIPEQYRGVLDTAVKVLTLVDGIL